MKKTLAIFLSMAVLLCAVPHMVFAAATTEVDGMTYELNDSDKTATLTKGKNVSNVEILGQVNYNGTDYTVTTIGNYAFYICYNLKSVTIPNSVTSIDNYAFYYCGVLASITIPASVESIGKGAFYSCDSLRSINVDPNNKNFKVEDGILFSEDGKSLIYCSRDKAGSYTIPDSVKSIGDLAFSRCSGLTSVTIGSGVESIGDLAFYGSGLSLGTINVESNPNLTVNDGVLFNNADASLVLCSKDKTGNYEIPSNITTIGGGAFYYCSKLTSVTIPNSVTSIGNSAFVSCRGLTSVEIPDSVTTVGNYAFSICGSLTSVTIGNGVTTIGDSAFKGCGNLAVMTIGNKVESIGTDAFGYCSNLKSITIPCNFDPVKFNNTGITVGEGNTFTPQYGSSSSFVISHDINKVERREPDCVNDGEEEHYKCSGCNTLYDNADGENIISEDSLKLKAPGHNIEKVERREPDCANDGEEEHYKCSRCGALFSDEAGTKSVTVDELKLSKVDHNWGTGEVTTAATPEKPGVKTYTCSVCGETKTEPVEYVSVPGGSDNGSTDLQPDAGGGDSNSTSPRPDAGGSDNNPTNSHPDAEPAAMAKRATIKTGDQLGIWVMFYMALLLLSAYGVLVGVRSRRKKYEK